MNVILNDGSISISHVDSSTSDIHLGASLGAETISYICQTVPALQIVKETVLFHYLSLNHIIDQG